MEIKKLRTLLEIMPQLFKTKAFIAACLSVAASTAMRESANAQAKDPDMAELIPSGLDELLQKPFELKKSSNTAANTSDGSCSKAPAIYDGFNGSQFSGSRFIDTDFGKRSYRDDFVTLPGARSHAAPMRHYYENGSADSAEAAFRKRHYDQSQAKSIEKRQSGLWKESMLPVLGNLGDWVPALPDPMDNGSFSSAPDNGYPVPYRLNGHLNFERKYPWKKGGD